MTENTLIPIETRNKIDTALEFFHSLKSITCTNDQEYQNCVDMCIKVKTHIKQIDSDRKDLVKPFNDKVNIINGDCNGVISKLKNAETVMKNAMSKYYAEKERKRIEEQKRLEAEAEEKRRQEAERARREAEKEERYREQGREEMADRAAARAETAQNVADTVVAPIVQNTAKVSGTSFKTVYRVTVKDKAEAIRAMTMNAQFLPFLSIDVKGLEKLINAAKGNMDIPGIEIIKDTQVAVRTK